MERNLRLLAIGVAWLLAPLVNAQVIMVTTELTGASENPPTGSPGFGVAAVEFNAGDHTLKVHIDFMDLLGTTMSADLHCCIAQDGNLAAATSALAGFPLKVTRGSTNPKFEVHITRDTATWNPDFLKQFGSTAHAERQLADGLQSGTAYLTIRTSRFPNGEIRGVLKPDPNAIFIGGPATRPRLLGTQPLECSKQSERCLIPIYARTYGSNVLFCEARIDFSDIKVYPHAISGKKIRAIWLVVNGEVRDRTDYRFAPTLGVDIGPTETGEALDQTKDFNAPGGDNQESRRFKWNSVHARTVCGVHAPMDCAFMYNLNVERYDPADDRWKPCTQVDPTISNR